MIIDFVKWITLIISAFSLKLNVITYREQIELEVQCQFLSRFFCILGTNDFCDAFGERIKSNMMDLLENDCSHCSLQMQAISAIAFPYVKEKFPDLWKFLEKKYYHKQEGSIELYFANAYECLLQDLNCNSSFELLKKAMPFLLKLQFVPGRQDITILFGTQLKIIEKKYPFIYTQLLDKFISL